MGLVLILTGGAVCVLKAYNAAKATESFAAVLLGLRQQAAVVATLSLAVFLLLEALEKGKVALGGLSLAAGVAGAVPAPTFGRPSGVSAALATSN